MAVETPATIAILGAGPIGLEAALYARFLGYEVEVYERGRVAENVMRWGHVRLFSPFRMNRSSLGLAALAAQDQSWTPPAEDALLTGRETAEAYWLPLAASDLLADHIRTSAEVLAIGRDSLLKGDLIGDDRRAEAAFRILSRDAHGQERISTADVVIDTTGTFGNPNRMGAGGIPALGEAAAAAIVDYGLSDVAGEHRALYAGRRVLLVGGGYSAATSAVALADLSAAEPDTHVTWITRGTPPDGAGPIPRIPDDPLAQRDRLAQSANRLAMSDGGPLRYLPGTLVDAVYQPAARSPWNVRLIGLHAGELAVDRIIANVGYHGDNSLCRELQVHECYATGGPMRWAAALLKQDAADCLRQRCDSAETLVTPEPDFYILGAKSNGRNSHFLISVGLQQIQQLFTIIGDRADLNLYDSVQPLGS